jgi:hypothetical protein
MDGLYPSLVRGVTIIPRIADINATALGGAAALMFRSTALERPDLSV